MSEPKYLFIIDTRDYAKSKHLRFSHIIGEVLRKTKESNINPSDCLVWVSNESGTFGEEFWVYVSGMILRNRGYFVTQYAGAYRGGADLSAYYIPDYIEKLTGAHLLGKGAFVEELEMLKRSHTAKLRPERIACESVVVEAESSDLAVRSHSENGVGQLIKQYLSYESGYSCGMVSGPFCGGYKDIHCEDERCSCKSVGLISCDEKGNMVYLPPTRHYLQPTEIAAKINEIKNLIKCVLLRNISYEDRQRLIGLETVDLQRYLERILNLDIDRIIEKTERLTTRKP